MKGKFNIKASSFPSPIVGTVINTIDLTRPNLHELTGNPPTKRVDIRKTGTSLKMKVIYRVSNQKEISNIEALNKAFDVVTVIIDFEDTSSISIIGKIVAIGKAIKKEDVLEDDFTIWEIKI